MLNRKNNTIILFLIVLCYFLIYKLPKVLFNLIKVLFSFNQFKLSILYEDCYKYDPRSWYLQLIEKGFLFIILRFVRLKLKRRANTLYLLKQDYRIRSAKDYKIRLYIKRLSFIIFFNQKLQFFYLLYMLYYFIYTYIIKRKIYIYIFNILLAFLRMIFGKFVTFIYNEEEILTTDYIIRSLAVFFENNYLLISVFTTYIRSKLNYAYFLYYKFYNSVWKKVVNVLKKNMYIYIFNMLGKEVYLLTMNLNKFIVSRRKKKIKEKKSWFYIFCQKMYFIFIKIKKNTFIFIKIVIYYYFYKNKSILMLNIWDSPFVYNQLNKYKKNKLKTIAIVYWLKIWQVYNSFDFVKLRNINYFSMFKSKIYREWFTYKIYIAFIHSAKNVFKYLLEKDLGMVFNYKNLDLFWRGDNFFFSLINEYVYIWGFKTNIPERVSDWSLSKFPFRDFLYGTLNKEIINLFRKRFIMVKKMVLLYNITHKHDIFFWFKDLTLINESIWFIYDDLSLYLKRNYMLENNLSEDLLDLLGKTLYKDKFKRYYNNDIINTLLLVKVLNDKRKQGGDIDINEKLVWDIYEELMITTKEDYKVKKDNQHIIIKRMIQKLSNFERGFLWYKWLKSFGLKLYNLDIDNKSIYMMQKIHRKWHKRKRISNYIMEEKRLRNMQLWSKEFIIYNKFFTSYGFIYGKGKIKKNIKYIYILKKLLKKQKNTFKVIWYLMKLLFYKKNRRIYINIFLILEYMKRYKKKK